MTQPDGAAFDRQFRQDSALVKRIDEQGEDIKKRVTIIPLEQREAALYGLVADGEFSIDDQGRVWRHRIRRGSAGVFVVNPPRRAEKEVKGYLMLRSLLLLPSGERFRVEIGAHRVVFRHFNGVIPIGLEINHKNGNKADNRPCNLELATGAENTQHAVHVLGKQLGTPGESHYKTSLSDADVVEIRRRHDAGEHQVRLAEDFGVTFQAIHNIVRFKTRRQTVETCVEWIDAHKCLTEAMREKAEQIEEQRCP